MKTNIKTFNPPSVKLLGKLYFEMLACAIALAPLNNQRLSMFGKTYKNEKLRAILPELFLNNELDKNIKEYLINSWRLPKAVELLSNNGFGNFEPETLLHAINEDETKWLIGKFIEIKENDCREFYSYDNKEHQDKHAPLLLRILKKIFWR